MNDITESVGSVYRSLRQVFEDINKLGRDFGQGLRDEGLDLTDFMEYSYSPSSTLSLKANHTWFYSRPLDKTSGAPATLVFAACFVYFEADRGRWKVGPMGRPELWFFLGKVSPPPTENWAATIQTFFKRADEQKYDKKPALGGQVSFYKDTDGENWDAVCLGYDLGDVDSAATMKAKALKPLIVEATRREIIS